ncbi:hypothetical protein TrST_g11044 [Triparma strigata]|uniref:Uncharacterized protein n=1 Tax=Triparma strigata TaxID=1606541 RepID=A0A9W6ZES4_9STRA|nr:hypothetical protein TrST_g11044 [Triparma strigata]
MSGTSANVVFTSSGLSRDSLRDIVMGCNSNMCSLGHVNKETGAALGVDSFLNGEGLVEREVERLEVLKSYQVLDSISEGEFERITALAARVFNVPIALISLVDVGRQWFKSNHGLGDTYETPRDQAFCAYTIQNEGDFFIIEDATKDERFMYNPLVTGPPDIRMYAGTPLVMPEGYKLGSFCIIDNKPKPEGLTIFEKQTLRELADMVVERLVMRKNDKQKLVEDKSKYMASTAHDLLTPLTGMQLSLSLAKRSEDRKEIHEYINTSLQCAEMMGMIVNRSMSLFSPKSKRKFGEDDTTEEKWKKVNVISIFDRVKKVIKTYPKSVDIELVMPPTLPQFFLIKGSGEVSIYQATLNFLTNACKATNEGWIKLTVDIKDGQLYVECEDTGCGVKPEQQSELFVPFSELNKSTLHGTGLGLYSVASHIKRLDGHYGYRSRGSNPTLSVLPPKPPIGGKGGKTGDSMQGSIFWFRIPAKEFTGMEVDEEYESSEASNANLTSQDKKASLSSMASSTNSSNSHGPPGKKTKSNPQANATITKRKLSALIIDDSLTVRKPLARAIKNKNFDVETATNGLEGLERMKKNCYDLVLCDFLMPIMDGIECVKNIRTWENDHRAGFRQLIIGISANAGIGETKNTDRPFSEYGFDGFQPKPVSLAYITKLTESAQVAKCTKSLNQHLQELAKKGLGGGVKFPSYEFKASHGSFSKNKQSSHDSSMSSLGDGYLDVEKPDDSGKKKLPSCLVAEDSVSVQRMLKRAVESAGFKVYTCSNADSLIDLLKKRTYALCLIDSQLEQAGMDEVVDKNGTLAVKKLKEWEDEFQRNPRQRNIWSISGGAQADESDPNMKVYDGFIEKPIPFEILQDLLKTVHRNWSNRQLVQDGNSLS